MKNIKLFAFLAIFLLSAAVSTAWATADFSGDGTEESPYKITSVEDLNTLAERVNAGNDFKGKYFKLTTDIEYSHTTKWENASSGTEHNFTPIGVWDDYEDIQYKFNGIFDGDGKTIRGIRINSDEYFSRVGLFGYLGGDAEVKNLRVADAVISAYDMFGTIAGLNYGKIRDCIVDSVLFKGVPLVCGGIAGFNQGTLSGNLVIRVTISTGSGYGAVAGINSSGRLSNNFYTACTFAGVENATNVGIADEDASNYNQQVSYDVTDDNGAVSIHAVTLGEGISITSPKSPIYTDNDKNAYYMAGEICTITVANEDGIIEKITGVTASNENVTMNLAADKKSATFTMPSENVTITAEFPSTVIGYTVSVPGNIIISEEYATIDGVKYYKPGKTYTLIAKANVIIDEIAGVTASNAQVTVTVADDKKSATFTMPHENVTITATTSEGEADVTLTSAMTEWTDGNTYNVSSDVTIGSRIVINGAVTLNLGAGATLTASKGIEVSEGNSLTIEGDGTLNATGDSYTKYYSNVSWSHNCGRAGIGAENVGTIIINSGNINATGGAGNGDDTHGAAGIGGSYNNTTGGSIIINGGVVNATGSERGAGIGGGNANGGGLPGSITINGGQVTANGGYGASGIGKGGSAGAGQATLTLGWTKMTDFIHASSIGSGNDFSSITFVEGKKFAYEGTETVVTASNIVEKDDNGKKIVPLITMTDLSNAVIGNVNTNYTYSGSEISITPAVSLDNNVLTGGEDYTVSYTKGGNSVTAVQEPGVYTLTVTGAGSLFHGSKSFVFSVQGSVNYQAYENGTLTDKPSLAADGYTTVVPSTTTMSAGWYVVSDNVTVSDRISVSGDVHLVLCDGATLTAQNGIGVTEGNSLTIYSQSGNTGKLVATVLYNKGFNFYHAAIGGDRYGNIHDAGTPVKAGSITIHGGDITATSYFSAAGIGKAYEGKAGNITIYGGKVTASCGDGESDIGIGGDDAVIQLGYARTDDYIQSLGYIGSVTVASDRKFATDDATPVDISGSVGDLSSINGKKLTSKTYTVSFSLGYDGGTAPDAQIVYHGLTKAIEPTAPTRTIYSFGGWKNGSTAYDFTAAVTSDLSLKAIWTPDPAHFSVNDAGTEYTIHTAEGWGVFCDLLAENDKGYFDGKTVKLDADIGTAENPVTRMAGSLDHEFTGIFDGRGHTLTVNLTGTSDYTAPFVYVKSQDDDHPIIIRNLKVAGTITTAYKYAAGIAADCRGIVHIENSQSSVTINSSKSGDGTHGGLVGYNGSSLTITGSAFTGKLITTNGTTHCGGFVGWINTTTNIINSLYAPAALADGETEVGATESSTFGRKKKAAVTITNSYYTRSFGTEQGLASRTITADEGVTIDAVAPVGDATETYTVSSITAYANGITCGGKFYYGNGDQVSLTLSHEDPAGYSISGYTASAGTLTSNDKSYLLAMPENGDVTISRSLAKLLTNSDISISAIDDQTYIGSEICPEITVTDGKASLELNTDYTVECSDNVNAGTATMAITGAGNYAGSVAKMFEIAQAPVTVSGVNAANKVYDGTTSATIAGTAIVSGVLGNDDVGVEYGTAVFADANVGEGIAVAFSGFTLTGVDKGNYYLSNQPASVTANITKAPLTITAKDKAIVYGDEPANDGVEYSGLVGEENEAVLGGELSYSYDYKKLDKVGKYTITPSGLTASNYEITFAAGTLTVEKADISVEAPVAKEKLVYSGKSQELVTAGKTNFGTLLYSLDGEKYSAEIPAATDAKTYTVYYKVEGSDNWNAFEAKKVEVKIDKAPLTVTAKDKSIVYGKEPANDGVKYSGFVGEENESVLGGKLSYSYNYKKLDKVGKYTITPSGLTADNYEISFVAGALNVEPKATHYAAVQVLEDENGKRAEIDGEYGEGDGIVITEPLEVASVEFSRDFSTQGYSTIVLPFDVNTSKLSGVDSVLSFARIVKEQGEMAVGMKVVWEASASHVDLKANTPYMVKMTGAKLGIDGGVTLLPTEVAVTKSDAQNDGWEFRGTYAYKSWQEGDDDLCRVYGFAGGSNDEVSEGDFVKFTAGASLRPLRAYLINTNRTCSAPKMARAYGDYVLGAKSSIDDLPESMKVVIVGEDGHTTVIGHFNTRTGEFTAGTRVRKFDLKGRTVRGTPSARGAYYGKRVKK